MARKSNGIALALGGGGARGFAHVGVLEVLIENNIHIGAIAGSSAGAVAGAGYAAGYGIYEMRHRVLKFAESQLADDTRVRNLVDHDETDGCSTVGNIVGRFLCRGRIITSLLWDDAVLGADFFPRLMKFFLPETRIEDLPTPFGCVATDINSGEPVYFSSGPLRDAVIASCAVPGAAPVAKIGQRNLLDGGVVILVPVDFARTLYEGSVLAVNVIQRTFTDDVPDQAVDIFLRAMELQGMRLNQLNLEKADLVIEPQVGEIHWADFKRAEEAMDAGRKAAEESLDQIKDLVKIPRFWQLGYWRERKQQARG